LGVSRAQWQFGLGLIWSSLFHVRENLHDCLQLLDAGDDLGFPPQPTQASISMPNTRLSRRAQLIATCRGVGGLATSAGGSDCGAPIPRRAGVTAARRLLCGAAARSATPSMPTG
jgi:hypothetical protein